MPLGGGFNAGAIFAELGFRVDDDGAARFDRRLRTLRQDAAKPVAAQLKGDYDKRAIEAYERKLHEVRDTAKRRQDFKAQLGAEFDNRAFRAYEKSLRDADEHAERSVKAQGRLRTAFGSIYGRGGVLFAAAGGLYGLQAAGKAVIGTASDINESLSKNRVLFGQYADAVDRFSQTSARSFGISRQAALEYTGVFGNLFTALGVSRKESAGFSVSLTKLAADMASFNNTSIDDALEAIRSGLVGETEPLRRFGVNLNDAQLREQAMSMGLTHTTKNVLTPYQRSLAAQALIVKQTDKAHGDFHRTQGGLANQTRILQARISDAGAALGAKLLPYAVKAVTYANKLADGFERGTGDGGKLRDTLEQVGDRLKQVYDAGRNVVGFLSDHTTLVKAAAGAWVSYKLAVMGAAAVSKASALTAALPGRRGGGAGGRLAPAAGAGAAGGVLGGPVGMVAATAGVFAAGAAADYLRKARNDTDLYTRAQKLLGDQIERLQRLGDQGAINSLIKQEDALTRNTRHFKDHAQGLAELAKHAEALGDRAQSFKDVGDEVARAKKRFDELRKDGGSDIGELRAIVKSNTARIRDNLGKDTAEGREALAKNFRLARSAIRESMRDGTVSVRDGLGEIRQLMRAELKAYGITGGVATSILRHGDIKAGGGAGAGKYGGGWIGQPGMVGADMVPAMLAPGEAVLNRHQQAVIEGLLGGGFLDRLFAQVRTPHYMAEGGRAERFAAGGVAGAIAAANRLEGAHFPYRWGGGHQGSPAPFGPMDCSGAVSFVLQHAGVKVPTMVSGQLANAGRPGSGVLTVFANAGHTFMRIGNRYFGTSGSNPGGGAGWFPDPGAGYKSRFSVRHFLPGEGFGDEIRPPQVGGQGALRAIAQGALNAGARGANRHVDQLISAIGLGTGDPGDPGPGMGKAPLARLWTRAGGAGPIANLMAAIALAESGGDPNAIGPQTRYGRAKGLWQILGQLVRGNIFNPFVNARNAVAKYRAQGLNAWEAYTNGRYRQFLALGGRPNGKRKVIVGASHPSVALPGNPRVGIVGGMTPQLGKPGPGTTITGTDTTPGYDLWTAKQAEVEALVRAGLWTEDYAVQYEKHVGQRVLAGDFGLLSDVERWDIMGDLRELAVQPDSGGGSADLQAQTAQAVERARVANERADIAERSLKVLGSPAGLSPGAIGMAPPIIIQTLHPADPQTLSAVARAANAGNSYGGNVRSPRVDLKV